MKNSLFLVLLLILTIPICQAQNSYEREHRIRKSQFPAIPSNILSSVSGIKQERYYKEIDDSLVVFTLKFKKDRLRYFMDFNPDGQLLNMGFRVNEIDIPSDTYAKMLSYLTDNFKKVKIRFLYQEYPVSKNKPNEETIKNALQNLLLPGNIYKLILIARREGKRATYESHFDAEGNFVKIRQSLPPNYDHILY